MNENDLSTVLKEAICDSFAVRAEPEQVNGPRRWSVRTPCTFDDGDVLPVFIQLTTDGTWEMTDDGLAVSHLFFDEFQFTDARFARVEMLVDAIGAQIDAHRALTLRLDGQPTAFDIGDFIQLLSQVQGVALTSRTERDQTRYLTAVRSRVEERLLQPNFEENWSPPSLRGTRASYKADLRMANSSGEDVVLFAASTSDRVSVSTLCVHQFRKVYPNFIPVLAYHPDKVTSEAVYRFQDEVQDDTAVVATLPEGIAALEHLLRDRGVELTAAGT